MASGFGRVLQVKRTEGRCAMQLAAYLTKTGLSFEGSCAKISQIFDFSNKVSEPLSHKMLIPKGADEKFKNQEWLWNHVAKKEKRVDSQEATHYIMALPKEKIFSKEDLEDIADRFAKKYFLPENLVVSRTIHFKEDQPHVHFLFTQRAVDFKKQELSNYKATEFLARFRSMPHGIIQRRFLDDYFKEKGLDIRCDPPGIVSQIHLGAKGTYGRAFDLQFENLERIKLNAELAKDPKEILQAIIRYQSVFSPEDVDRFIDKHTPETHQEQVRETFWKQPEIVQMLDKKTGEKVDRFSTLEVIREENKLMKVVGYLKNQKASSIDANAPKNLSEEQREAFDGLMKGEGIMCLKGLAGTGKSYVLKAVRDAYMEAGVDVVSLGADSPAANALKDKGITEAMNMHRLMYAAKHGSD